MSKRNIYQGPDSCYAQHEGRYVKGRGVNVSTAKKILRYIARDLRRGWTYDHSCRRIKMTPRLAAKRANYLVALSRKHYGEETARRVKSLVSAWHARVLSRLRKRGGKRAVAVAVAA